MVKILVLFCFILFNNFLFSEVINFKLPAFGEYGYYHELLKQSLEAEGYEVKITELPKECEQKRVMEMMGADSEQITLTWVVQTEERDREFVPVEVGITNGLIGKRILLIPKGSQIEYNGIKTIEDLKKLGKVGGFGKGWFDIKVWEYNGLKTYEKDGSWDPEIYRMVASKNRGIDYFSRGAHEIAAVSKVITVNSEKCKNCHACITVCPAKFCNNGSGDFVDINENLCIGCGNCIKACTHNVRVVVDDFEKFMSDLKRGTKMVAISAPADSPMLHTIKMIKEFYLQYRNHKVVVISPCAAKKREFEETGY